MLRNAILIGAAISGLAVGAAADTRLTQVTRVDPMEFMGQQNPASSDTMQIWYAGDKLALVSNDLITILRTDKGAMYLLMPETREYFEYPLEGLADTATVPADQMVLTATVTRTEETRKIGNWNTRKYTVATTAKAGMTGSEEIWATNDIDLDSEAFAAAKSGIMARFPGFAQFVRELAKVDGVPVLTNYSMNVFGTTMTGSVEVLAVETKPAPEGIYDVPAGYVQIDLSQMSPH